MDSFFLSFNEQWVSIRVSMIAPLWYFYSKEIGIEIEIGIKLLGAITI